MADLDSIQTRQKGCMERPVPSVKEQRFKACTFPGKSFYLDLSPGKQTQLLTKAIVRLGGVIESFLSRDVNYVVTGNKKVVGHAAKDTTGGRRTAQCKITAIESAHCSRGKQLLKKVIQNQECNSVLASACSWGVTIVHVDDLLEHTEYLEHRSMKVIQSRATTGKGVNCRTASRKVAKLKSPFLKIEDQSRKYRPIYCTFASFPEISYVSSDRGPFETVHTRNSTRQGRDAPEEVADRVRIPQAQKRKGYCECCEKVFSNLEEHLLGENHRRFASSPSHYTVIDNLVAKLPFDFQELSYRTTSPDCCGSAQEMVEALNRDNEQNIKVEEPPESTQEGLVTKTAIEGNCSEVIPNDLLDCVVASEEPMLLNHDAEEFVCRELDVVVAQHAKPSAQNAECAGASAEFVPSSLETMKRSKLPLALTDFLSPVLSLFTVHVGDLPEVDVGQNLCNQTLFAEATKIRLANTIAPSLTLLPLKDDLIVNEHQQTDRESSVTADQPKDPVFCAGDLSHMELSKRFGPGQLGSPLLYQNEQQICFTSTIKPLEPLIWPPLPCGYVVSPFASISQAIPSESIKSSQTPQDQETLVTRTHCRRTKRKFSGSPYPPPSKRALYKNQPALDQTISFPIWMGAWGDKHQISIPHWADWSRWDGNEITKEGPSSCTVPCFKPKLTTDTTSSEFDWDVRIAPPHKPPQQTQNYGHLQTAQIDLNESWYMKQLCSVLVDSHTPVTTHCVPVTSTL